MKAHEAFHRSTQYGRRKNDQARAKRDYRSSWCKVCKTAYDRAIRAQHPERYKATGKKNSAIYFKDHRQSFWQSLQRARRRGAVSTLTLAEFQELRTGRTCHWCGMDLHISFMNIDHIVPLSEGGEHSRSNLVTACANCNMRRKWERQTTHREIE